MAINGSDLIALSAYLLILLCFVCRYIAVFGTFLSSIKSLLYLLSVLCVVSTCITSVYEGIVGYRSWYIFRNQFLLLFG
jgi:hypothetical protein